MLLQLPHWFLVLFVTLSLCFFAIPFKIYLSPCGCKSSSFGGILPSGIVTLSAQPVVSTAITLQAFFMVPLFAFGTSYHVAAIVRHAAYAMQFAGPTMQSFRFLLLLVYGNHVGHESFHVHFLETLQQLTAHYTLVDYCLNWILIKRKHSRKSYGK